MVRRQPALRLYLVRHGEVAGNRRFAFIGRLDEDLTDTGRDQAAELAVALRSVEVEEIVSSPLRRCLDTARLVGDDCACPVSVDDRLIEQAYGDWEGLDRRQIEESGDANKNRLRRWLEDPALSPPGGEDLDSVQTRALSLIADLRQAGTEAAILVSHVGPIKALVCATVGAPLGAVNRFFLDPGSITVVDWGDRPMLRALNLQRPRRWQLERWSRRR